VSGNLLIADEGLAAWRRGVFETLERIFDPAVEWRWFERVRGTATAAMT
jgi:hypothetical protein